MKSNVQYFLLILLLFAFPIIGNAVEGVRMVCDEPVYQFGSIPQSAVVTNIFTVRNEGDLTFTLKSIRVGCGCTKARMKPRMIGPGETAEVTAVFKAKRRRGSQKKSIRIYSIDSLRSPVLTLYMNGFVDVPAETR